MTKEQENQILDSLIRKAEEIAVGLRELSTELTAQSDNFTSLSGDVRRTNLLQNCVYDVVLRADLMKHAAQAFLSIHTIRHRYIDPASNESEA